MQTTLPARSDWTPQAAANGRIAMRRVVACVLLAISPLACSGNLRLDPITQVPTGEPKPQVLNAYEEGTVDGLVFLPDGKQVVSVGRILVDGEWKNLIKLWDLTSGLERGSWPVDLVQATSLSISADGKSLALCDGGKLILWDLSSGRGSHWKDADQKVQELTGAYSSAGQSLAVLEIERLGQFSVKLKCLSSGSERSVDIQRGLSKPHCFSPDLRYVTGLVIGAPLIGRPDELIVWDLTTGKPTVTLTDQPRPNNPHSGTINVFSKVAFSPDSQKMVTGTLRGLVAWETLTGKRIWGTNPTPAPLCYGFSPDSKALAVGGLSSRYGTVSMFDANTGASQIGFAGSEDGLVESLAISPDGKMLVFGDRKGMIHAFDLTDPADYQANDSFQRLSKEKQKAILELTESRKLALVRYWAAAFRKEPTKRGYEGVMHFSIGDSSIVVQYVKPSEAEHWSYKAIETPGITPVDRELGLELITVLK